MGDDHSYRHYGPSVAYVEVIGSRGPGIGSAFHIGEGVFVTARHVVEDCDAITIATTRAGRVEDPNGEPGRFGKERWRSVMLPKIVPTKVVLSDTIDAALLVVPLPDKALPVIWVGRVPPEWLDGDVVLSQATVFGYPPVPGTKAPILLAHRCEVNAVVADRYLGGPEPHFIISAMARGGFSGGPVIAEHGTTLGLVTQAMTRDENPLELGYMTVLAMDPVMDFIESTGLLPSAQKNGWGRFGMITGELAVDLG